METLLSVPVLPLTVTMDKSLNFHRSRFPYLKNSLSNVIVFISNINPLLKIHLFQEYQTPLLLDTVLGMVGYTVVNKMLFLPHLAYIQEQGLSEKPKN